MSCRPAGKFLAVSGEFGPGKRTFPRAGWLPDHARAEHHGQFEELLSTGRLTVRECGLGEGTQLHPLKGPICRSRNRGPER